MGKFNEWFKSKVVVGRYPMPTEIDKFDYILNVSDEYISAIQTVAIQKGIKYFWFPMSECNDNMGINSIYGALQILWIAESENKRVLLHCHAGANRSPTVAECYYYMRTKKYPLRKPVNEDIQKSIESMFTFEEEQDRIDYRKIANNSRLENNIIGGHLPSRLKMEDFLKKCEKSFQKYSVGSGGQLDVLKIESHIQSY